MSTKHNQTIVPAIVAVVILLLIVAPKGLIGLLMLLTAALGALRAFLPL